jgi:O-antigen biosynthesis protein
MIADARYSVAIGVYVHAEPLRLQQTLTSLREHTTMSYELLVLSDGADAETQQFLCHAGEVKQSATTEARGVAACFNRLCASTQADVVVLLESGCRVGPGWLDHLLAALMSEPCHGLAGPSTNLAWNEQCVYPGRGDSAQDIRHTAEDALQRFGSTWRTLAPLYSLADFCYAVRREVVNAIGVADEGYGLGPCWEMDYNIRAARAGFIGVWAGAAYVQRAPFTTRRSHYETALMEASKWHYQNKFCARQRRGGPLPFRSHCRGDDCPNFAPAELIPIRLPFPGGIAPLPVTLSRVEPDLPLVTCIMPTADRRAFLPDAIRCFLTQDYPRLELLVVDDGEDPVQDSLPDDPRIRYWRLDSKTVLGKKRNLACAEARGGIVVHWDDDDWYPPWRVRTQVEALLKAGASVCGTSRLYYHEPHSDRAWEYRYRNHRWVAGNTLAYRRDFWTRHPFPEVQVGEDNLFVGEVRPDALLDLSDPTLCVATIHSANTSRKVPKGALWLPYPASALLALRQRAERALPVGPSPTMPLVSCIMPTHNRRQFIPLTLENFFSQTYKHKELIVVDDGSDPIADLVVGYPGVRYLALSERASIGAKRNLACAEARGEIIAHWDDDDWYGPDRLERQVLPVVGGLADVTGLQNGFVLVLPGGEFWTMDTRLHRRMFVGDVHGGTLVFRKSLCTAGLRYPDVNLAEDAALLSDALKRGARLMRIANTGCFVYVRHGRNAWKFDTGRFLDPRGWQRSAAPPGFELSVQHRYSTAAQGGACG